MKSSTKRTLSKAPLLSLWTSVLLATVQCSGPGDSEPLYPPNVLLITLDTLRADHLGCYGYDRPTSPNIDAFAKVATFYPRGYASSPWTLPTHASLMTGLYPFEHGAHTFKINEKRAEVGVLGEHHVTLAEVLRDEGFQTAALVGNDVYLKQRFKIHQGFETYFSERTYADRLNKMAFEWLEERGQEPFFLFLNYVDTHNPYNARKRPDDPGFLKPGDDRQSFYIYQDLRPQVLKREEPYPAETVQHVTNQYDTAIHVVDEELENLFEKLKQLGLYDNTLIILTSDHGEYFGEHELIDHGKDVYQPAVWVPLIIKKPGQHEGEVDETIVTSAEIPNLIFQNFPADMAKRGFAQFPLAPGAEIALSENYFTMADDFNYQPHEQARFNRVRTVVFDWPYKYIHDSSGNHELYDLAKDPEELQNLYATKTRVGKKMARQMRSFMDERNTVKEAESVRIPNEQEIESLRALGYLSDEDDPRQDAKP